MPPRTRQARPPKRKSVAVGEAAPEWKDLEGAMGAKHSSAELKDAKGVVVVFTCNHCPVAQAYEDRIIARANDYKEKGIELVAINVNNMEEDKLPAMKERAEAKGYKFDYLYDPSQAIGRAFGATVTPHVFLLDGEQNLVYAGAIDDNMEVDKVEKQYLRDAIDAVLAGSKPETDPPSRWVAAFGMNEGIRNDRAAGLIMFSILLASFAGCSRSEPAPVADKPQGRVEQCSVVVTAVDRAEYDAALVSLHGKAVLVDCWATWCTPCLEQLPHSLELAEKQCAGWPGRFDTLFRRSQQDRAGPEDSGC